MHEIATFFIYPPHAARAVQRFTNREKCKSVEEREKALKSTEIMISLSPQSPSINPSRNFRHFRLSVFALRGLEVSLPREHLVLAWPQQTDWTKQAALDLPLLPCQ